MGFFAEGDFASLKIERMVFHLIGPRPEDCQKLEALDPGVYEDFFVGRLRSVNSGTPMHFRESSPTLRALQELNANRNDDAVFQRLSEELADSFKDHHGGSTSAGAFLVFQIATATEGTGIYAFLKYDDETVLTYDLLPAADGRRKVSLEQFHRTFVQNKEALQKSALIRLSSKVNSIVAKDRSNPKIARYFVGFLGAEREIEDSDATVTYVRAAKAAMRAAKKEVPEDVFEERGQRTYDAVKKGGDIEPGKHKAFLDTVCGFSVPENSKLFRSFDGAIKRARLDGAGISLDPKAVKAPQARRYRTSRGVVVKVPNEASERVEIDTNRIVINDEVVERDDDANATETAD